MCRIRQSDSGQEPAEHKAATTLAEIFSQPEALLWLVLGIVGIGLLFLAHKDGDSLSMVLYHWPLLAAGVEVARAEFLEHLVIRQLTLPA